LGRGAVPKKATGGKNLFRRKKKKTVLQRRPRGGDRMEKGGQKKTEISREKCLPTERRRPMMQKKQKAKCWDLYDLKKRWGGEKAVIKTATPKGGGVRKIPKK